MSTMTGQCGHRQGNAPARGQCEAVRALRTGQRVHSDRMRAKTGQGKGSDGREREAPREGHREGNERVIGEPEGNRGQ